jgi:8-oxo-dGTP pyrophosphatase MutT (NUDIX family)|tara:strand:+ start:1231 stop:1416 length:186 start_codon:yes stop_codon:yes gene_type:complete
MGTSWRRLNLEKTKESTEREVKEETGLIIKARNFFEYSSWVYDEETHIFLMAFNVILFQEK